MKTLIRVVKKSKDKKDESEPAVSPQPRLTTEMVVKSWITESREHRRNRMSQLQTWISWKELGGLARG